MARKSEEIEDEVRGILLKARTDLGKSWGDIYYGRALKPADWQATQTHLVETAIARARQIMAQEQLDLKSVEIFERYRIAELQTYLKDAIWRVDGNSDRQPPEPEPTLSKSDRQDLETQIEEFLQRLRRRQLPRLEPAEAKRALQDIDQQSSQEWARLKPGLDLDLDLQRTAYQRWQEELKRLSDECGLSQHLAARFEKTLISDLPETARPKSQLSKKATGLFYDLYFGGQVCSFSYYRGGEEIASLKLQRGRAEAKYEDGANVAEFHRDNRLEEYGGRYERESRYPHSFRHWVLARIQEIAGNWKP